MLMTKEDHDNNIGDGDADDKMMILIIIQAMVML